MLQRRLTGFTLAELLISLAILGEIATFTIPKILTAQQNGQYKAVAKEDLAAISAAYQQYQYNGSASSSTTFGSLTPYINYVAVKPSGTIDDLPTVGSWDCGSTTCIKMHNGSVIGYMGSVSFGGTGSLNAIWVHIDPDGGYSGTTNGSGKALSAFLYYNGRVTDESSMSANTVSSDMSRNPNPAILPTWFSW